MNRGNKIGESVLEHKERIIIVCEEAQEEKTGENEEEDREANWQVDMGDKGKVLVSPPSEGDCSVIK